VLIEQSDAAVTAAAAARHSPSNAQQQQQQQQQQYKPALIVVPDADVAKWEAQLALYLPDVNTVSYTGCARSRELILQHELLHAADAAAVSTSATAPSRLRCHVLLTSHSVAKSDAPLLHNVHWGELIVVAPAQRGTASPTAGGTDIESSNAVAAVAKQFILVQARHKVLAVTPVVQQHYHHQQQQQQQQLAYCDRCEQTRDDLPWPVCCCSSCWCLRSCCCSSVSSSYTAESNASAAALHSSTHKQQQQYNFSSDVAVRPSV
jgi:hypothetical protein